MSGPLPFRVLPLLLPRSKRRCEGRWLKRNLTIVDLLQALWPVHTDRKSTRLNSSHAQ